MKRVAVMCLTVMATSCSLLTPARVHTVKYQVDGFADEADVTYTNAEGGTQQENGVQLPWKKEFQVTDGQFIYISAQLKIGRTIKVEIHTDGKPFKESTSSGEYTIATANGRCCP